jgi:hypothetical protein
MVDEESPEGFKQLNKIRMLTIDLPSFVNNRGACFAEDNLFDIFTSLPADHKLRVINIDDLAWDDAAMPDQRAILTSQLKGLLNSNDSEIEACSTAVLYALLADPVYSIPGVLGDGKLKISINFTSGELQGLTETLDVMRAQSRRAMPNSNYQIFSPYFKMLWNMEDVLFVYKFTEHPYFESDAGKGLVAARIRGDVQSFRQHHEELVDFISRDIDQVRGQTLVRLQTAERRENDIRKLQAMIPDLEKILPSADVDTSSFGYNLADRLIVELMGEVRLDEQVGASEKEAWVETV